MIHSSCYDSVIDSWFLFGFSAFNSFTFHCRQCTAPGTSSWDQHNRKMDRPSGRTLVWSLSGIRYPRIPSPKWNYTVICSCSVLTSTWNWYSPKQSKYMYIPWPFLATLARVLIELVRTYGSSFHTPTSSACAYEQQYTVLKNLV